MVKKYKRNQRIGALMKIFAEKPNYVFSYNYFSEIFNAAKSTISEDISIVKKLVEELDFGKIETIAGASGGVIYIPVLGEKEKNSILSDLCNLFAQKNRIIAGGFIYLTDLFNNPSVVSNIAKIISSEFSQEDIDHIVTVETKGIPVAVMTAKYLNVPVAVIRRNNKVTEGATVSINYVSGSSNNIQTMSLSRRSLNENAKVLIVDDFMKGGGTAKGMADMMREFNVQVVGTAVVIETKKPDKKLVDNYLSLLVLNNINEKDGTIEIEPNWNLLK
ncbi:pur operon repressor [Sedimentibacter sp. MB31-C6]|uniref:pur operon repressor n=1 Tax=Sedimentibacter sp. MB31-C6 TaxID=3109366 RepID=UPI002DDD2729|nr:pur operon repressor [Sedimentibacter sp. MB36-C1]WSI03979.1 pur operon repressor [Sedimentibacter sp. MB36-C1]